ncbi:hypothetical protein DFH06DRAFT_1083902, partial [Mycena polygramma]
MAVFSFPAFGLGLGHFPMFRWSITYRLEHYINVAVSIHLCSFAHGILHFHGQARALSVSPLCSLWFWGSFLRFHSSSWLFRISLAASGAPCPSRQLTRSSKRSEYETVGSRAEHKCFVREGSTRASLRRWREEALKLLHVVATLLDGAALERKTKLKSLSVP